MLTSLAVNARAYSDLKVTPSGSTQRSLTAAMCGSCDRLMSLHPYYSTDEFTLGCDREPESFGIYEDSHDYYKHSAANHLTTSAVSIPVDFSGNGVSDRIMADYNRDDEYEYISADVELFALDAWRDKHENECTHATEWWTNDGVKHSYPTNYVRPGFVEVTTNSISPEMRQAYVEGNDAFFAREFLDLELTEKYQRRLLNWFVNKQGKIQIGAIRFVVDSQGNRIAECVNPKCPSIHKDSRGNYQRARLVIGAGLTEPTREQMEFVVYEIIKHGNNCGPSWLVNSERFYQMNALSDYVEQDTDDEEFDAVGFLMDHRRYCNDAHCTCGEWLDKYGYSLPTTATA